MISTTPNSCATQTERNGQKRKRLAAEQSYHVSQQNESIQCEKHVDKTSITTRHTLERKYPYKRTSLLMYLSVRLNRKLE